MESVWLSFSSWFWTSQVWLPAGVNWEDLVPNDSINYASWNDLWSYPLVMAVVACGLRFLVMDKFIFGPLAKLGGIKDIKPRPVIPNTLLEQVFRKYPKNTPAANISHCASTLDWSERRVERWLRQRAAVTKINKYTKFKECAWQFTYYSCIFVYGLYVMMDKPWLTDIMQCWYNYPHHSVERDIWWYYMISLSFYWSMIFTHFFETRRKDFWQMFFHHLLTVVLITVSWTCNFTRVGTLILLLHDCADIPLQGAKLCIYLEKHSLCDAVFALFAVVWILTRVCIFPLWILHNTLFEATDIIPIFPAYYIFNGLLVTLFVLHVYWTYYIIRIIVKTISKGKIEDDRSSSDDPQLEEEEEANEDDAKKES